MPLQKWLSKTLKHFSDPMVIKTQVGLVEVDQGLAVKRGIEESLLFPNKLLWIDNRSILIESVKQQC